MDDETISLVESIFEELAKQRHLVDRMLGRPSSGPRLSPEARLVLVELRLRRIEDRLGIER